MIEYRRLEKGEVIEAGDEIDACADGWRDHPAWEPVGLSSVGTLAPDPAYPSHRQYRRPFEVVADISRASNVLRDLERMRFLVGKPGESPAIEGFVGVDQDFWECLNEAVELKRSRSLGEDEEPNDEERLLAFRLLIEKAISAETHFSG